MFINRNTILNLVGSIIPLLFGLVTIPHILQGLGGLKFGLLTLVWTLVGYASIFDFGMSRALTYHVSLARSKGKDLISISHQGLKVALLAGIAGCIAINTLLHFRAYEFLNIDKLYESDFISAMHLVSLAIPITTITLGLRGIIEGLEDFTTSNIYKLFLGISNFVSPLASIYLFGPRLAPIAAMLLLTRLTILICMSINVVKSVPNLLVRFRRDPKIREENSNIINFGIWMTISNIISPFMLSVDRFIITRFLGSSILGTYAVIADTMQRYLIVPAAYTTALFPFMSRSNSSLKSTDMYLLALRKIFYVTAPIMIITSLFSKYAISFWLGSAYGKSGSILVPLLSIGILSNSLAQIPYTAIHSRGSAKETTILQVIEFVLFLPLCLWAIKKYSIYGAALAWSIRTTIDFICLHMLFIYHIDKKDK